MVVVMVVEVVAVVTFVVCVYIKVMFTLVQVCVLHMKFFVPPINTTIAQVMQRFCAYVRID